jgi:predicted  nucleic acid-binding Zn-ribbon protein
MGEQVTFKCLRCGHEFRGVYDTEVERMCPKCRSNSVRRVKEKPAPSTGAPPSRALGETRQS